MPPATTTPECEETRLVAAIRTHMSRLAALPRPSAEGARCHAELRSLRAQLEALYRRWAGPRGVLVGATLPTGKTRE
jgi:hypothetical protein